MIEIGGQPAIRRVFSAPSPQAAEGRTYYIQTYIVNERALYVVTVTALSAEALDQHQAEMNEIINSIQFTS